ncbi:MAG: HTTM domain-containing protein [Bacteroidia bacterium]|jgi:hypothetical protein|nr:HTTM domain-containing protein [Bacteroidia bacterium]
MKAIIQVLNRRRSITPLVTFRITYGLLLFFSTIRFWYQGWMDALFIDPTFHFKYYGFHWVKMCPDYFIAPLFFTMTLAALCVALGFFYRYALSVFLVLFTYFELVDATNYLNHHYLVILFGLLLLFAPAHRYFSLDVRRGSVLSTAQIPRFYILAIILQIAIVYTYAGIAKLNSDWLFEAMPLRIWILEYQHIPVVGGLLRCTTTAFIFSWFAAFYDCTIIYFLLFSKTRKWAYFTVILFHFLTALFFNIGIFPWLMILSNLIFLSDSFHNRLYRLKKNIAPTPNSLPGIRSTTFIILCVFFIIQLLVPLRHLAYSGNTMVTELGYRFGWRVMLLEKAGIATFTLKDEGTERSMEIANREYLTDFQEKQMAIQPDFMLQFAAHIAEKNSHIVKSPSVYVTSFIALNGRVSQPFIQANIDLLQLDDDWSDKPWITCRSIQ